MVNITFINVSPSTDKEFSVHAHKTGCAGITRTLSDDVLNDDAGTGNYGSQREAWEDYNQDFIEEEGEEAGWAIKFLPCCDLPKR